MDKTEHLSPIALLASYEKMFHQRHEEKTVSEQHENSYLAFQCGAKKYLIKMSQVLEVVTEISSVTPLPFAKKWLLGLINQRGEIYSVVDFQSYIGDTFVPKGKKVENYVLLRDVGEGYILKVNAVFGIRTCNIEDYQSSVEWIDGKAEVDNEEWLFINLNSLVTSNTFIQSFR